MYRLLQILLELVTLDAEKVFDTNSHEIMLNKLFHDVFEGDMWILLRNIYQNLSLKVKWNNKTSESINILPGVRQGSKLSSLLYKRYNNTVLNAISTSNLVAKLGNIHVGSMLLLSLLIYFLRYSTNSEKEKLISFYNYNIGICATY